MLTGNRLAAYHTVLDQMAENATMLSDIIEQQTVGLADSWLIHTLATTDTIST